jgi:NTP pyrophosphatase (non-canonical NTP hydrolase)
MSQGELRLREVQEFLREFAEERDWVKYHTPKNLAMALAAEAGELLEILQWMTPEESVDLAASDLARVRDELADVLQYLIRLAEVLDVDITEAL